MPRRPALVLEFALLIIGALAVLFGLYTYYAPASWLLADLTEGWHLASFTIGATALTGAFSLWNNRLYNKNGSWSVMAVVSAVLAVVAITAAVIFAESWII
jgi:hypothetical protein